VIATAGTETIDAAAFLAGIKIVSDTQATTTLDITTAGSLSLNSNDSNLTVALTAGANVLKLGALGFITAVGGTSGTESITAGAAGQTLESEGGFDTLTGYAGGGDVFAGACSSLSNDTILNFQTSDLIDIKDLDTNGTMINYIVNTGKIVVGNSVHSVSISLPGAYTTANFGISSDGTGGTFVHLLS
jgi:hypothetical protein